MEKGTLGRGTPVNTDDVFREGQGRSGCKSTKGGKKAPRRQGAVGMTSAR